MKLFARVPLRSLMAWVALGSLWAAAPGSARAAFHLWDIQELFSDASGSLQFIELHTSADGQQFVRGHDIRATQGTIANVFTFPTNSPSPTAGRTLLIATASFEDACGVKPDFVLPDDFLFRPDGTVNFVGADQVAYAELPQDGSSSLHYPGGASATNTPTNFAGASCELSPPIANVPTLSLPWLVVFAFALLATVGAVVVARRRRA